MPKCTACGQTFHTLVELESHFAGHALRPVQGRPLSYVLCLPDGVTSGRHEAAVALADAYQELREKHPNVGFLFFPFSYKTGGNGENPSLSVVLAIAETASAGEFTLHDGAGVEWFCGTPISPPGDGWVNQGPVQPTCWHRIKPTP